MKCQTCGAAVRLPETPPGTFFLSGMVSLAIATGAGIWARLSEMHVLALVVCTIAAGSAVMCLIATWTAMTDCRSMGHKGCAEPGRRCDACNHITPIRPWSR
jgi:hypothetical protein